MADGLTLRAQDRRGALATSPTIVILIGKHGDFHSSLILIPDVDVPVGIVSEERLAPLVVLLPVFFLGGRCCIILHLCLIVIVVPGRPVMRVVVFVKWPVKIFVF